MKNILVTGGAGFIGGNFIHYLLGNRPDCHITCLDALTYAGNLETLKSVLEDSRLRFVHGDITDREAVYHLFEEENFDAVVNFAAESHVDRSIDTPEVFLKTNILGTQVLLEPAATTRYLRMRFTVTFRSTGPTCFLQRKRLFTPPLPTLRARRRLICL